MPEFQWPENQQGAVSLTFDDAHPSQIDTAIPILEEYGLLGTFYVNPTDLWMKNASPWRDAALKGHEIGNHTIGHVCAENFSFTAPKNGLESMTLERIEADIEEAESRLRRRIPEQTERSFCYPCYQSYVGRGESRQSYVPVVAKRFLAARGRGEAPNHPLHTDIHYLSSWTGERASGPELVGYSEQAATQNRWAIFTFHGVQSGHLMVAEADFRELCAHLARHQNRIWTAPVAVIARYILDWKASHPSE